MSQEQLFPETQAPQPTPVDTEAIAAAARPNPYAAQEAREAAIDELRGESLRDEQIGKPLGHVALQAPEQRLVELPGRNGRNNWYNQPASRSEARRGLTPEQLAEQADTNAKGAAGARMALGQRPRRSS
jgi:hypothetical protein